MVKACVKPTSLFRTDNRKIVHSVLKSLSSFHQVRIQIILSPRLPTSQSKNPICLYICVLILISKSSNVFHQIKWKQLLTVNWDPKWTCLTGTPKSAVCSSFQPVFLAANLITKPLLPMLISCVISFSGFRKDWPDSRSWSEIAAKRLDDGKNISTHLLLPLIF